MHKLKFKNKSTVDYANLLIHDIGIKIKPKERIIEHDDIPGRSGTLIEHTGIYEAYERKIILCDKDGIHDLENWFTGSGNLELSTEPDGFYKASVIDFYENQTVRGVNAKFIEIPFLIQPFFYLNQGQFPRKVNGESTFYNSYNVPALPTIKVIGNGDLEFYFNNKLIKIKNVTNYAIIDSDLLNCYDANTLKGKDMTGNYPVFSEKINSFKTVNCELEVTPRWCTL